MRFPTSAETLRAVVIAASLLAPSCLQAADPIGTLNKKLTIERELRCTLKDFIGFLSDLSGMTVRIDSESFKLAGETEPLELAVTIKPENDVPLFVVLRVALTQLKASYRMEDDAIIIVSALESDVSPAARSLIATGRSELKAPTESRRVAAALMLAELGPKARPARTDLCRGLLDAKPKVRRAAADALASVDKPFADMAATIVLSNNIDAVNKALAKGYDAEPLVPLIFDLARRIIGYSKSGSFSVSATKKFRFAPGENPLLACLVALGLLVEKPDVELYEFVTTLTAFREKNYAPDKAADGKKEQAEVRRLAAVVLAGFRKPDLALPPAPSADASTGEKKAWEAKNAAAEKIAAGTVDSAIKALGKMARDDEAIVNRVQALKALPALADERTRDAIILVLNSVKKDPADEVRRAADAAYIKLGKR